MVKKEIVTLLILGAVLLGIIFVPGYLKIKGLARENKDLEMRIKQVSQENQRLAEEQRRLKNDPFYLEKVVREKLGLAKEGEVIYRALPQQSGQ